MVGPKVGDELKQKGLMSILLALGAILLYIWWRFELHFGFGALVALVHDVIITVGIFSLFDKQFDLATPSEKNVQRILRCENLFEMLNTYWP